MEFLATIYVKLKPTVNDPQGLTVHGALKSLGFLGIKSVRVGKYLEIEIESESYAEAEARVQEMCLQLLTNPVIEESRFDLVLSSSNQTS
ncbi:MAG: phosphoribosylformylglycinamidine synthase subunit PurS [SAR202 cluster bacterium]|nr:phosphoribosylformylglycinamidine synthase subunit PurS [SAR202 cluster bacterium]|tara:strand:+ start:437 stop:706 length:270 start_codon:yes stop_codon:yes gene_type:complete